MATTTLTPTSATAETTPKLIKKGSISEMKSPSTPMQTSYGCQHIKALLQAARQQATDGYGRLIQSLRDEYGLGGRTYKSGNGTATSNGTTYLCLQCANVSNSRERHRKDHAFAVESDNGFIYCHDCRDFVYDPTFEELRTGSSTSKKRKHSALQSEERKLVNSNAAATPCAAVGLRGLYNMGQTCFMSVVIQSLVHNPLIRSWYLSEGHKSSECERDACTACALDDVFTDFYAQEKHEGYGAVHLLQGCWKLGGGMAGYSQQDAHEFLGSFLNSLHTAFTEDDDEEPGSKKQHQDDKECECVIHQTFAGLLKSTVTCSKCKNVTTASDPFMDLSLDIRSTAISVKKKKLPLTGSTATVKEVLPMDLTECLDRFTGTETLSSDSYRCRKCESDQEAKKKLSLYRLPPVVPIHLKRFSHSKSLAQSSKVDTRVRFPFTLDLAPYLITATKSSLAKSNSNGNLTNGQHKPPDPSTDADGEDAATEDNGMIYGPVDPIYELSSVIVHKGKIDSGHYVSYCRQGEHQEWFRFDDSMVVQVEEREVLGAEAYMLFYVAGGFQI